ncbi:MAG: DUF819 family protein [Chitinophagaceae bacterium]|nr:DUF819 family protein [Chitinophagaceae bacterium]
MLLNNPVFVIAILILLVVFSEWLARQKYFKYLGSSLIIILAGAVLSNLHIIPSSQDASVVYDGIFTYIAPLAIFYLLLDVRLKDIRLAGVPMLSMFLLGAAGTIVGTLVGYLLLSPQQHNMPEAFAVAGMFTGTYIGGSVNLNAVALHYGVIKNGTLFAAINAADNIITTIWIILTITMPPLLQRLMPRKISKSANVETTSMVLPIEVSGELINISGFSSLLFLGLASLVAAQLISFYVPQLPSVIVLTTLALVLAQVKGVQNLKGGKILGLFMVLLFLAVVGAYCDISALIANKETAILLLEWVTIIAFVHGIILFGIGGLFKVDWNIISIASNANIGGATSAAVLATSLNRKDLRLPGILAGAVGTGIGTYLGLMIAGLLK